MEAEPAVPEKAPEPVAEMSFYDSYMASRFVVVKWCVNVYCGVLLVCCSLSLLAFSGLSFLSLYDKCNSTL